MGSSPAVTCVVAQWCLPLWKMTQKGWRAAVSYSQKGGGRTWRNETGAEVKETEVDSEESFSK